MANESWVGFARSPKPDASLVSAEVEVELNTSISLVELFNLATGVDGLSQWLVKTTKADVRTSGKVEFIFEGEKTQALFSAVDLGKRAILNSEAFGEISFIFGSSKTASNLKLKFSKMVAQQDRENYIASANHASTRLAELVAAK